MTLRHLRIFIIVYQNKSITKAAQQLFIAQPSVSLAIQELEAYYGVQLFERISRRIFPTENADKLYGYAIHIISLYNEMESSIRNRDATGTLRVGSSITIGNHLLPYIVKEFQLVKPEMKVAVKIDNTQMIEQMVLHNELDIALIEGKVTQPKQLINQVFLHDELCLIVSNHHPLAAKKTVQIKDLAGYDFLLREQGSAGRAMVDSLFIAHDLAITPIWESVSTQAIICGVANDLGISILPYLLVKDDIKQQLVTRKHIKDMSLSRHFSILYHKNKLLTPAMQCFLSICSSWSDQPE